ncbi:hypothetical protein SCHPADRAFT_444242 [Schizopora paradoxa]|uniref:Uncharacterized protein n=1 Tax=Schizopora paradoxa TaxID=27342 RepID=A0A0H2RJ06_9AGAM|nr:hypothetical protein SCHPADRAFT_444242 [Schizopora paradoxa]
MTFLASLARFLRFYVLNWLGTPADGETKCGVRCYRICGSSGSKTLAAYSFRCSAERVCGGRSCRIRRSGACGDERRLLAGPSKRYRCILWSFALREYDTPDLYFEGNAEIFHVIEETKA